MRYLLFMMMLIVGFNGLCQYPKAFVNQGSVTINNRFKFPAGKSFDIRPNLKISLHTNTIVTCKRADKISAYSGAKIMTYEEVMNDLDKSNVISNSYFENMFSGNYNLNQEAYGSVGRELDGKPRDDYYFPRDSMRVISDIVELTVGNPKTKIVGPFFLIDPDGRSRKIECNGQNSIQVKIKGSGEYHWGCDIIINGEELSFDNVFFVPDRKTQKRIQKEYKGFVKSLNSDDSNWIELMKRNWMLVKKCVPTP